MVDREPPHPKRSKDAKLMQNSLSEEDTEEGARRNQATGSILSV